MAWSTLTIALAVALVGAAALVAIVETWSRTAPTLSRWPWLADVVLGLMLTYSAFRTFASSDPLWGLVPLTLSGLFLRSAVKSVRRARRANADSASDQRNIQ